MMVLADLDDILIRASYDTEMRSSSISGVRMEVAVPQYTGLAQALEVEQCQCPPGYRGLSCQVGAMWSDACFYVGDEIVLLNVDLYGMFFRTVHLDTLAQVGACTWATASHVNVTATLTPVTQKPASARYEEPPTCNLFYL